MSSALLTDSDTMMPHRVAPFVKAAVAYGTGSGLSLGVAFAFIEHAARDPLSAILGIVTAAGSLMLGYASYIKSHMAYVDWKENREMKRLSRRLRDQSK